AESLTNESLARHNGAEHVGQITLVAGDVPLGLQAMQQRQHRRVGPAPALPAQDGIDIAHRARTVLPEHLEHLQLRFTQVWSAQCQGLPPVSRTPYRSSYNM